MRALTYVLLASTLLVAPVRAQDEDDAPKAPAKKKVESRNDILKKAFKDVAAKDATFVVKVGSAYGVILDGKVIATTSAAVKGKSSVKVSGSAGSAEARVLGVDEKNAVGLVECPFDAKGIELAGPELTIGQYVISVGNEPEVLCAGVLSAKNRKVEPRDLSQANLLMGLLSDGIDGPKRAYPKVLQHDAPMSDDLLGSALVDSSGKLVGMNVGTGYRGSSYAIAAKDLAASIEAIKSGKQAAPSTTEKDDASPKLALGKPWLGASVKEEEDGSLVVQEVAPGGPAAAAGIQVGDRIYAIDGQKVATLDAMADTISQKKPGDSIVVSLMRHGDKVKVTVKLGEK